MNNKPIGIFDSGLGGLTAVKELISILPNEDIVYFGDTGRVPYGARSKETIIKYTKQDINFLMSFDIKVIIAACGTASSVALPNIENNYGIEVIGVVEPTAKAAVKATKNKRIAVLGTVGTINSNAYENAIKKIDADIEVFSVPCPLFVHLVENGHVDDEVTHLVAKEYLEKIIPQNPDTIILGCTHYPLLKNTISAIMGEGVSLIDAGKSAADHVKELLMEENILKEAGVGNYSFYVSDSATGFLNLAQTFLDKKIDNITKIDIENIVV